MTKLMSAGAIILACGFALAGPQPPAGKAPAQKKATGGKETLENYYRDAKVGDWVSYKMTASGVTTTYKHSVIAKTPDEITLRYEIKVGDMALPATENKINLKESYDPDKMNSPDVTSKVEKLGSGSEAVTVGGKRYECTWTKNRVTHTQKASGNTPEMTTVMVSKTWTSKDVPLGGAVKTETETNGQTSVMELTGFGRGK